MKKITKTELIETLKLADISHFRLTGREDDDKYIVKSFGAFDDSIAPYDFYDGYQYDDENGHSWIENSERVSCKDDFDVLFYIVYEYNGFEYVAWPSVYMSEQEANEAIAEV